MNWDDMSEQQRHRTIQAMEMFGGGFASRLAQAMYLADGTNLKRITDAFPEMAEKFGPGSYFFEQLGEQAKEAA